MYVHMCVYVYTHMCILYIYIYTKREREGEYSMYIYIYIFFFYIHICMYTYSLWPPESSNYCFESSSLYGFHSGFLPGFLSGLLPLRDVVRVMMRVLNFKFSATTKSVMSTPRVETYCFEDFEVTHNTYTKPSSPRNAICLQSFQHRTPMSKSTGMGLRFFCA